MVHVLSCRRPRASEGLSATGLRASGIRRTQERSSIHAPGTASGCAKSCAVTGVAGLCIVTERSPTLRAVFLATPELYILDSLRSMQEGSIFCKLGLPCSYEGFILERSGNYRACRPATAEIGRYARGRRIVARLPPGANDQPTDWDMRAFRKVRASASSRSLTMCGREG